VAAPSPPVLIQAATPPTQTYSSLHCCPTQPSTLRPAQEIPHHTKPGAEAGLRHCQAAVSSQPPLCPLPERSTRALDTLSRSAFLLRCLCTICAVWGPRSALGCLAASLQSSRASLAPWPQSPYLRPTLSSSAPDFMLGMQAPVPNPASMLLSGHSDLAAVTGRGS
jgi:hypothetical protein